MAKSYRKPISRKVQKQEERRPLDYFAANTASDYETLRRIAGPKIINPEGEEMEGKELVPVETELTPLVAKIIGEGPQYYTSLPNVTHNDRAKIQRYSSTEDVKISDVKESRWITQDIFASTVMLISENDGEIVMATRVVLISPDGIACSCVSEGAVQSIRQIVGAFGRPPWKPPLTLLFERKKTRKGFFTYVVTVAPIEEKV